MYYFPSEKYVKNRKLQKINMRVMRGLRSWWTWEHTLDDDVDRDVNATVTIEEDEKRRWVPGTGSAAVSRQ